MSALRSVYWVARTFLETRVLGTAFPEWVWRTRHLQRRLYRLHATEAARHPHRNQLMQAVAGCEPFDSLLEIGCGPGGNLYLLSERYPNAQLFGLDINTFAVHQAARDLTAAGLRNVRLRVGRADSLDAFPDKSIDVIVTDALLMFIGPDKIHKMLSEMSRVARRCLVLHEWASRNPPPHNYDGGRYIYDYESLLAEHLPGAHLSATASGFGGGGWDQYGQLITVQLAP